MYLDASTLENNASVEADVCIIGAGPAGITVALELADLKKNIFLLESGGIDLEAGTQRLNECYATGIPYKPSLSSTRLRCFGGASDHWSGFCAPLDPVDFTHREWIPLSGWPIKFEDLQQWYLRAQQICEVGGFLYDAAFWEQETGLNRLPLPSEIVHTKIVQFSPPTRFGYVYRRRLLTSANVTLWTHVTVTNIKADEMESHILEVQAITPNGRSLTVRAVTFVLACGGIENPRILLVSKQRNQQGLGDAYGCVGRYFMEHPHVFTSSVYLSEGVNPDFYQMNRRFVPLLSIAPEVQKAQRIANYSALLVPSEVSEEPYEKKPTSSWRLEARSEQIPNAESRVTLRPNFNDAYGVPQATLDWRLTRMDKETIRVAEAILATEILRARLGRLEMPEWLSHKGEEWPESLIGGPHHMGTTRMSNDPKTGVVDSNCKIHGIDNLYIAGSSVFPTAGTANPTLSIVALAARLAQRIKEIS